MIKPTNPSKPDYKPCKTSNRAVGCYKVPLEEVKNIFRRATFPVLASIQLTLQPFLLSETFIPEDIFGRKRASKIWIEYPPGSVIVNSSLSLQVHPGAFRSTKNYTKHFIINIIDCSQLALGFLSGFDKLIELVFGNINNIQHCLPTLPSLPRLTKLSFERCAGMNELHSFPALTNGLKRIFFYNDEISALQPDRVLNDETVDRIIDWLLLSSSNTLDDLGIEFMNHVTRVPKKITSFIQLKKIWLTNNNISSIKSGAFSFPGPISFLSIIGNGIKEIEPGAFQGKKHPIY